MDRLGVFGHGFTASGHPVATAVGLENVKIILEKDLVANVKALEEKFLSRLSSLAEHPLAASSRGVGLIGALEMKPFEDGAAGDAALALHMTCQEEGFIVRNIGEAICFCPPLIITAEQVDELFDCVARALDRVVAERG